MRNSARRWARMLTAAMLPLRWRPRSLCSQRAARALLPAWLQPRTRPREPMKPARTLLIACGALAREIAALKRANGWTSVDVRCLPAQLHNRPERIAPAVRAEIQANRERYAQMFVVYGDCGTRGTLDAVLKEE